MTASAPVRSLFGELLDWMLAPLLVIWPVGVLLTWGVAQGLAERPYDRELETAALSLAEQVQAQPMVDAVERLSLSGESLALMRGDEEDSASFQILGVRGELIAGDADLPVPEQTPRSGAPLLSNLERQGRSWRLATLWVRPANQRGWITIQVAETTARRERLATDIVKGLLLPQVLLLPLAVLLGWLALTQGLKPLQSLSQRLRRRESDDFSAIPEGEAPEELVPLLRATNELMARHGQMARSQKQFLADAAHQLKTPLAGLRTQAELALRSVQQGNFTAQELQSSMSKMARSSQRAADMVSQLLALARAESAELPSEAIDLTELAREVTEDFVPQALDKRIDLGYDGPTQARLRVRGQRWLLVELLRNLVDNALRYTPLGGEVTVRVIEDPYGQVVLLQVEDNGPGIAPESRERVFQPFYRALGTGVEGSGLGLTIAGQIAVRHGARLELEDARERRSAGQAPGARFTLRLPGLPADDAPPPPNSAH